MNSSSLSQKYYEIACQLKILIGRLEKVSYSQDVSPYQNFLHENKEHLLEMLGEDKFDVLFDLSLTAGHPAEFGEQARAARKRLEKARDDHDCDAENEANKEVELKERQRAECVEGNKKSRLDAEKLLLPFLKN